MCDVFLKETQKQNNTEEKSIGGVAGSDGNGQQGDGNDDEAVMVVMTMAVSRSKSSPCQQ